MIYIYTEDFFWSSRLKNLVKKMLGRGARGPQAVFLSLTRGLSEIGEAFVVNKLPQGKIDTACVLSGVQTLQWAVEQKKKGSIKKLVAGPNVVVTPLEEGGLILSKEIDVVVSPSQWVVDWWSSLSPELAPRMRAWPAGVQDKGEARSKTGKVLVFKKAVPDELLNSVLETLRERWLEFDVFKYGQSGQSFQDKLYDTNFLIYLHTSESQGLALQEAWMANIPTLVWNRGFVKYGNDRWEDLKAGAPYLTNETGRFFSSADEFPEALTGFVKDLESFSPRKYVKENLTDAICAKKYLSIFHE